MAPDDTQCAADLVLFGRCGKMRETLESGIENNAVGSRPLAVRQIKTPAKRRAANVLYVEEKWRYPGRLRASRHRMLTVSDAKGFARNGGIIELFTNENHLKFIINVDNARAPAFDQLKIAAAGGHRRTGKALKMKRFNTGSEPYPLHQAHAARKLR